MKAIRVHSLGGPEVLSYEDVSDPEPGQGQALVRVEAAGVNFIDVYFRTAACRWSTTASARPLSTRASIRSRRAA